MKVYYEKDADLKLLKKGTGSGAEMYGRYVGIQM